MTGSSGLTFVQLLTLFALLVPLGLVLLRGLERFRGRSIGLTALERLLLAPYLSAALLFVLASLGLPIYGAPLVVGLLTAGGIVLAVLWIREKGRTLSAPIRWFVSPAGLGVVGGTLALFALEFASIGTRAFPNAYDGSFQSLYLQLLLSRHSIAWTLEPYAVAGIIYPQAATVWLSLPIVLWGWSIPTAPVALPTMFLALGIPAAFCWGDRLGGVSTSRGSAWGLVFAASFGALLSLPRMFVGGSYDFLFGLPLFVLALGWLRPMIGTLGRSWRDVILVGGFVGILTALSLSLGEGLLLLLLVYILVYHAAAALHARQWIPRLAAVVGIACAFVARSIAGVVVWYPYPEHTLTATGRSPYAVIPGLPAPTGRTYESSLDPFVPLKPKLSPLPILSVEVAILLTVAIALSALWVLWPRGSLRRRIPIELVLPIWLGAITMFLWAAALVAASGPGSSASVFDNLASFYEASYLLFLFYQALALIPLIALVEIARTPRRPRDDEGSPPAGVPARAPARASRRGLALPATSIAALVVLAAALGTGVAVTAVQAPTYLSSHLAGLSNVTEGDIDALQWAGAELPSCSVVLVAPGSAGQFLPVYANVHVDFPMMPLPVNLSYNTSIDNLTAGVYSSQTRSALLSLGVTEVMVTGRTSVSYLPLDPAPLLNASDFAVLFHAADAYIFGFVPGIQQSGCSAGSPTEASGTSAYNSAVVGIRRRA